MSDTNWISIEDAGTRLKRTERQIYGYCRDGQLVHKKENGKMLVSVESVQAFMELHEGTRNMKAAAAENEGKAKVDNSAKKEAQKSSPTVKQEVKADTDTKAQPANGVQKKAAVIAKPENNKTAGSAPPKSPQKVAVQAAKKPADVIPKVAAAKKNGTNDADTPPYSDLLVTLRVQITKHQEDSQLFCADMFNLLDSLEEVCENEEEKGGQLSQEIFKLLSRYNNEASNDQAQEPAKKDPIITDLPQMSEQGNLTR